MYDKPEIMISCEDPSTTYLCYRDMRFKTLTQSGGQQVTDESIRDTLMDLANYAIMTILEMEQEEYVTLYANGEPYMTLKKEGKPDVQTGTDPQ